MKQEDGENPSLFGLSGSFQPWLSVQFQQLFSDPQSFELSCTKPFTSREGRNRTSHHSPELLTPHTSPVILTLKAEPLGRSGSPGSPRERKAFPTCSSSSSSTHLDSRSALMPSVGGSTPDRWGKYSKMLWVPHVESPDCEHQLILSHQKPHVRWMVTHFFINEPAVTALFLQPCDDSHVLLARRDMKAPAASLRQMKIPTAGMGTEIKGSHHPTHCHKLAQASLGTAEPVYVLFIGQVEKSPWSDYPSLVLCLYREQGQSFIPIQLIWLFHSAWNILLHFREEVSI